MAYTNDNPKLPRIPMIPDLEHTDEQGLIRCFVGSKPRRLDRKHKPTKINFSQPKTLQPGMKISDISVDISPIYLISVIFDTISTMIDISLIYRF